MWSMNSQAIPTKARRAESMLRSCCQDISPGAPLKLELETHEQVSLSPFVPPRVQAAWTIGLKCCYRVVCFVPHESCAG